MKINIYNSLTNKIEEFKPVNDGIVNMYICGPTVYDDLHIGNARPIITFDVLRKLLEHLGNKVVYASNITDVDDKIINNAIKLNISEEELINITTEKYMQVLSDLNIKTYTYQPKATEYITEMIKYIQQLINNNYAYEIDGDVYFRMSKVKEYGKISNQKLEDLISSVRIEDNDRKENQLDFTLWKSTDIGISWEAFGSKGRPGWHTECVVMINEIFSGTEIDIHGGGMDLKFPHHENELCQCEAHSNHNLSKYWMHNGFINFDGVKMSKSIGNVITIRSFIDEHGANTLRMLMFMSDYKKPLNITDELVANAKTNLKHIEKKYFEIGESTSQNTNGIVDFVKCLANDLNTAGALSYLFEEVKNGNHKNIVTMCELLGFKFEKKQTPNEILKLAEKMNIYRNNKDFESADKIREELAIAGYKVNIQRDGKIEVEAL